MSELSNDPLIGSEARIRQYLDRYGAAFASELYQWYIEKGSSGSPGALRSDRPSGKLRSLLDQDEAYAELLSDFLDRTGNDRLTWVHDVAQDRYWEASKRLVDESAKTQSIAEQSVRVVVRCRVR